MKNKLQLLIYSVASMFYYNICIGQDGELARVYNIANSQGAGSAGGNGINVDMFRGTLNANVPLYVFKGKEMNLPISLNYTANGIRVDQVASNVGLGWNLDVGGKITRVTSGYADDNPLCSSQPGQWLTPNQGKSDYYKVNAMGYDDLLTTSNTTLLWSLHSVYNPFRIVMGNLNNPLCQNAGIYITDENGTSYTFGEGADEVAKTVTSASCSGVANLGSCTTWMLTKVISKNKLDIYQFVYSNYVWASTIPNNGEGTHSINGGTGTGIITSSYRLIKQPIIKSIYHNGIKIIQFNYGDRSDLAFEGTTGGNALSSIDILNFNSTTVCKKIGFDYTYFGANNPHFSDNVSNSYLHKRLKLDKIINYGVDSAGQFNSGDIFKFDYITPELIPPIDSYGRDYLGLYNGNDNNVDLVNTDCEFDPNDGTLYPYDNMISCNLTGGKRRYNNDKAQIGTLSGITYPSKGYIEFKYEQNSLNVGFGHENVVNLNAIDYADGFRIESISNKNYDYQLIGKKNYKYANGVMTDEISSSYYVGSSPNTNYSENWSSRGYLNAPEIIHYADVYEVFTDDTQTNGYIHYEFHMPHPEQNHPFDFKDTDPGDAPALPTYRNFNYDKNDFLTKKTIFGQDESIKYSEEYIYDFDKPYYDELYDQLINEHPEGFDTLYNEVKYWHLMQKRIAFESSGSFDETYTYSNNRLITKTFGTETQGFHYNFELGDDLIIPAEPNYITAVNQIDSTTKGDTMFIYSTLTGSLSSFNFSTSSIIQSPVSRELVTEIQHRKDIHTEILPITQSIFDSQGNKVETVQYTPQAPTPAGVESYIYGYNDRFPIAKLSGVRYSEITQNRINHIKSASNMPVSETNDDALRVQLDQLRDDFPHALITTYTYNPVFGITSVTDSRRYTIYTEYDIFGRLKYTKEKNPAGVFNILTENQYNTISN